MEEKEIFSIKLANGTQITDLELNGNNFVSNTEITPEMFDGGLLEVEISSNKGVNYTIKNAEIIQILQKDSQWFFILRETPEIQRILEQISANIDYIAMETGVDLEV